MTSARTALLGGGALVGAAALAYARWEAASYRLRTLEVPALPAGRSAFRMLHLSDLHMTPRRARLQDWVTSLADLRPDLVVVTGDFLAHRDGVGPVMRALGPLLEVPGVFVLGSNDYYAPRPINPFAYFAGPSDLHPDRAELPWPDLIAQLTDAGWQHLPNQRTVLEAGSLSIEVRGVDDPHIERDDYAAVAGSPEPGVDLAMGVAHAPYMRVLDAMAADGLDITLAGHTHGGQVRVPGFGALVTNCDLDRSRARGLSSHARPLMEFASREGGDMALHVSAGLGTSPYAPIRFACPPEATLLTLVARG
ncbi:MAG: metallophosphoesterase [Candidatus Nanopelagicales bacterium]